MEAIGRMARRVEGEVVRGEGTGSGAGGNRRGAAGAFRRRLARGEYGGLLDGAVRSAMAQAAAERGAVEELGALRLALARLVDELGYRDDPLPVAREIARVAGAGIRAARAQAELVDGAKSELEEMMLRAIEELDAEEDAREAAGLPRMAVTEFMVPGWVPPEPGGASAAGEPSGSDWDIDRNRCVLPLP